MTPRPPLFARKPMHHIFATDMPTRLGRMGDAVDSVVDYQPLLVIWDGASLPDEDDTTIGWAAIVALDFFTLYAKVRTP